MAVRRLQKERRDLMLLDDTLTFTAKPVDDDNIFMWTAAIQGPLGSPYEGGTFQLTVEFPKSYPFIPPNLRFITPIYHPNINDKGYAEYSFTSTDWNPGLTLHKVLLCLVAELATPNLFNPISARASQQLMQDRAAFDATAREWTRLYASLSS